MAITSWRIPQMKLAIRAFSAISDPAPEEVFPETTTRFIEKSARRDDKIRGARMMNTFNPLDHPICYAYPIRLAPSGWIGHVPFAMYLIDILRPSVLVELGTHNGVSYCSFCQAVKELKIDTRCYAIDTWQGDPQAGLYGPEVLEDLKEHHDPLYGGFSRLIQSSFGEAAALFENGAIDLLHIDGFHSYEAVKHDFETWLPKLSEKGVVLFHDINVRERDFGVWRLWQELRRQYPHFEFIHSHGLGLLAVGQQCPEPVQELLGTSTEHRAQIREVFCQLGTRLEVIPELRALRRTAQEQSDASTRLQESLEAERQQSSAYEGQLKQLSDELARKNDALARKNDELASKNDELAGKNEEIAASMQYQNGLLVEIKNHKEYQSGLEQVIANLEQGLETIAKKNNGARDQLRLYSLLLAKQANRMSNMHGQISDLEVMLNGQAEKSKELRAQLSASEDQVRKLEHTLAEERERAQRKTELLDFMSSFFSGPSTTPPRPSNLRETYQRIWRGRNGQESLQGNLNMPVEDFDVGGYLEINGWAYSTEAPISRVGAFLDNVPLGLLRYGEPAHGVISDSTSPIPSECGFSARFPLDEFSIGRRMLLVRVIDERGNIKDFRRSIIINEATKETLASVPAVTPAASDELRGNASLAALPEQVPVSSTVGFTEIMWDTGNGSEGEVYVSVNGEPETLFATGPCGSKHAPWILAGLSHQFRLYAGAKGDRLLKQVSVRGVRTQLSERRDVLRGALDAPVEDLNAPYLQVSGWAYSTEAPIIWVEVFLDDALLGLTRYGEPRPDVQRDSHPLASINCGFSGKFFLGDFLVRPATLLARAADERGNVQFLGAVTLGQPTSEPAGLGEIVPGARRTRVEISKPHHRTVPIASPFSLGATLDPYDAWLEVNQWNARREKLLRGQLSKLIDPPLLSLVMLAFNPPPNLLDKAIRCVANQVYSNWELCIADDASTDSAIRDLLQEWAEREPRIRLEFRKENGNISHATNSAAELARGEYLVLMDQDDEIPPDALGEV